MNTDVTTIDRHHRQLSEGKLAGIFGAKHKNDAAPKVVTLDDDYDFISRVRHVMKKQESAMAFVARTGLSPSQAKTLDRDAISRFVKLAEERNLNEPGPPPFVEGGAQRSQGVTQMVLVG